MAVETRRQIAEFSSGISGKILTGAGAAWQTSSDFDITQVFGLPGGANLPLYHEYRNFPNIHHTLVRHEAGAAFMASGYGRTMDRMALILATSGPGGLNIMTGLKNMKDDSTAGLAFTGQVPTGLLNSDAFQEADMVASAKPNTKWAYQIQSADEIPQRIAEAIYIANEGRPGPVLLDFPKDIQLQKMEYQTPTPKESTQKKLSAEALAQIQKLPDLLKDAQKPCIFVGHGTLLSGAKKELLEFAEKTGIPVAYTFHASSAFPVEHHQNVGLLGMHGNLGPNRLTEEIDLAIVLGARLDDRITGKVDEYLPNAKIVQVDVEQDQIGKHKPVELGIKADVKSALLAATELVKNGEHSQWLERFKILNEIEQDQVTTDALANKSGEARMAPSIELISEKTNGNAILAVDVGMHQMFALRHFHPGPLGRYLSSGGLGAMGYGFPAAIGAKMATQEMGQQIDVVAVVGDGGFQMTMQELAVARVEQVAVGVVVLNNHALGMVEEWQKLFHDGNKAESSNLYTPEFAAMASAGYGIQSRKIDRYDEMSGAIDEMLDVNRSGRPYLLEVVVPEDEVYPMIPPGSPAHKMMLRPAA